MTRKEPSRRKGLYYTRKTLLLLTVPVFWILHECVWQTRLSSFDLSLRGRRVDAPRVGSSGRIGVDDLPDIAPIRKFFTNHSLDDASWEEAIVGREKVVDVLTKANLRIDLDVLKLLPTWDSVKHLYGDVPVILGLERCAAFRKAHKPSARYVGVAGNHNCGTNAMVRYLKQNLDIQGNQRGGFSKYFFRFEWTWGGDV